MIKTKIVEVKINAGWLGGSSANKMNKVLEDRYPDWEIVNGIPNYVNPVLRFFMVFLVLYPWVFIIQPLNMQ